MHHLDRIISGGQTGADQAGLFVAERFGIPTGGWAPHGWRTSRGPAPALLRDRFHLVEHRDGYAERTRTNVATADGTLRLAVDFTTAGERCTLRAIRDLGKPSIDVDLTHPRPVSEVVAWLQQHQVRVLNVAGNREQPRTPGTFPAACHYLRAVLESCGYTLLPRRGIR